MTASADRSGTGLVVVCCARADTAPLEDTLRALLDDGHDVELVAAVDIEPKLLSDAIERRGGEGLYVLCQSNHLGREAVEQLRELLLAGHVPFARTLTVALGGRGALVERIRAGLKRVGGRGGGSPRAVGRRGTAPLEDEEPTLVGHRDYLMGSPAPVIREEPSEPLQSAPAPARASALPPTPPRSPAPPDDDQTAIVQEVEADLLHEDTSLSNPRIDASELDLSDLDAGDTGARLALPKPGDRTAPMRQPAHITGDTVIGPAPAMITGQTLTGAILPDRVRKAAEAAARRMGINTPDDDPPTRPLPPTPIASPSPAMATAVALPGPTAAPAFGMTTTAPAAIVPVVPGPPAMASRRGATPWLLGGGALLALGIIVAIAAWPKDEGDSSVASSTSTESKDDSGPEPKVDGETKGGDDSPTPEPATTPEADTPVMAALRARRVRALDVLLVATELGKAGDYADALAYCDALQVEGLSGWRLPQVGELGSLSEAKMIERGYYWSATPADTFGDQHLAWNERRGYAERYDKPAQAVCVRGERPGS